MTSTVDDKYYAAGGGLASRLSSIARDGIYDEFIRLCAPTASSTILDVGVSDVLEPEANVLERRYPCPQNITACGLGDSAAFRSAFTAVSYVQIEPNKPLPFEDRRFDIATCNAVLEHVGSVSNQALLVRELCRVATKVFVTVPHRYFPVEHHTAIPFAHYTDATFRLACALTGKSKWTEQSELILMTKDRLRGLFVGKVQVGYCGLRLGPFSSNLYAFTTSG